MGISSKPFCHRVVFMYVCVCNAITETEVRESVAAGAETLEDLQLETGVATCCGTCVEAASSYLPNVGIQEAQPVQEGRPVVQAQPALGFTEVRWVSRSPRPVSKAA